MTPLKPIAIAMVLYVTAGIVAFGHSAANFQGCGGRQAEMEIDCQVYGAICAGVFWPLYLSWVIFDQLGRA